METPLAVGIGIQFQWKLCCWDLLVGTAVSRLYGIAKNAYVESVRCLDQNGSGSVQGVVNAINFVANLPSQRNVIR